MLKFRNTTQFRKDLKRMKKAGKDLSKFKDVAETLIQQHPLDRKYLDHKLAGKYKGQRECHLEPDWLLVYTVENDTIIFVRTGSHSELFDR